MHPWIHWNMDLDITQESTHHCTLKSEIKWEPSKESQSEGSMPGP